MNQLQQMFQFPTGWNSTLAVTPTNTPNPRFNSQRDGILQNCIAPKIYQAYTVSIPNGMEFYSLLCRGIVRKLNSFNSQRDGILPSRSPL